MKVLHCNTNVVRNMIEIHNGIMVESHIDLYKTLNVVGIDSYSLSPHSLGLSA